MEQQKKCHCGKEAILLQVKKAGTNKGRWFYVCSPKRCNFFQWMGKRPFHSLNIDANDPERRHSIQGTGVIEAARDRRTSIQFYIRSANEIGIHIGDNGHSVLSRVRHLAKIAYDDNMHDWIIPATYQHYVHAYETLISSPFYQSIQSMPLPELVIRLLKGGKQPSTCTPVENIKCKESQSILASNEEEYTECVDKLISHRLEHHSIWTKMKDYQQQGVRDCLAKGGRVLFADEMGLGKTVQSLAVALSHADDWPVLIICPASLLLAWSEQIQQWLPSVKNTDIRLTLKGSDLFGFVPARLVPVSASMDESTSAKTFLGVSSDDEKAVDELRRPSFYIISYDMAAAHIDYLTDLQFNFIICDESHNLKNPKAKRTKALTPLLQKAIYVLLLTGTPILSRPIELYPQLHILRQDLFSDIHNYGVRYCNGTLTKFGWDYSGSSNLTELNFILGKSLMIRRLKENVTLPLPSKVRQKVILTVDQEQGQLLNTLQLELLNLRKCPYTVLEQRKKSMELYLKTSIAKAPAIVKYLKGSLSASLEKVIIFAHHKQVLDQVEEMLKEEKISYIRIDGQTNQTKRHDLSQQFQSSNNKNYNEDVLVALLSITSCNTGLNLQKASTVIFAELYWNPSHLLQAEDRVHRLGQQNRVHIKYLLAPNTADNWLWPLVLKKLKVSGRLLDRKEENIYLENDNQNKKAH